MAAVPPEPLQAELPQADIDQLHAIVTGVFDAQLAAQNAARTFRTILVVATVCLSAGALFFTLAAAGTDRSLLRVTGVVSASAQPSATPAATGSPTSTAAPTPTAAPTSTAAPTATTAPTPSAPTSTATESPPAAATERSPLDIAPLVTLELWGMVGGLIGAIPAMWKIRGSSSPVGLQLAQLAVKIPTGAWTGLVGVILLQAELIPSVSAVPDHSLAAYAIIFGAGQQVITRFVDQRAGDVLDKAKTPGENAIMSV